MENDHAEDSLKRVLMIAYYFPPMGLSGVQRTAKFAKYLRRTGWHPVVLTCEPGGYFAFDQSLLDEITEAGVEIVRTRGWDPTRLFRRRSVVRLPSESKRRFFTTLSQFFFVPDNKIGWFRPARFAAIRTLRRKPIHLIYSTAPPYTSHLVGRSLAIREKTPLVIDFRDDWVGNPRHIYPTSFHRAVNATLERKVLQSSNRVVVINEHIRRNLLHRHPDVLDTNDVKVISQGFDPADFQVRSLPNVRGPSSGKFVVTYSGVFYDVQTPDHFLHALADLLSRRSELREQVEALFVGLLPTRARELIKLLNLEAIINHTGYLPHDEVIAHLCRSDVLWMTVGRSDGAETISTSKLFEYFGARKPILGLVPSGAARDALAEYGAAEIVAPEAIPEISNALERLYEAWRADLLPRPPEEVIRRYDRVELAAKLGRTFDEVLSDRHRSFSDR